MTTNNVAWASSGSHGNASAAAAAAAADAGAAVDEGVRAKPPQSTSCQCDRIVPECG